MAAGERAMTVRLPALDQAGLGVRAQAMLAELGAISSDPQRLVRLFLTSEHRRAADLVARWMREAGMSASEDALGTVRGRWTPPGGSGTRRLLIGSHIDTVVDAGKYDGPLGVVAGILAVEAIAKSGASLPIGLDVLAFGDEEGSRFTATLTSSSACAGAFDPAALAATDREGVTLADALRAYGKDPAAIGECAYARAEAAAYIEVHIEQGPVLEAQDRPLGIVTAIVGQTRMRATVTGMAGHAGTVPMPMRRDALAGAAEMILAVERIAQQNAADAMVATVGRIEASPGAVNVIAGRVGFTVDLRTATDALRHAAIAQIREAATRIAERRKLDVAFEIFHETATTPCDPRLQDMLQAAIEDLGHAPLRLPSGAGHDAQVMAGLCPAAMMFVRCRGGISHNPAEHASPQDMGAAVAALAGFIARFARTQG
ncbi:MAG: allantoate amidohydrolase [Pseudorhodoplanes sp.]|nr:allantoate amidohydrolase [Pseudorhodoplanes sp.]